MPLSLITCIRDWFIGTRQPSPVQITTEFCLEEEDMVTLDVPGIVKMMVD